MIQVLLRDSSDENVIPVLEELQRRLPVGNEAHHAESGEEDGTSQPLPFFQALKSGKNS